jgi:hypothetical protein
MRFMKAHGRATTSCWWTRRLEVVRREPYLDDVDKDSDDDVDGLDDASRDRDQGEDDDDQ